MNKETRHKMLVCLRDLGDNQVRPEQHLISHSELCWMSVSILWKNSAPWSNTDASCWANSDS